MPPPSDIARALVSFEIFNLNDNGVSGLKTSKIVLSPAKFMHELPVAIHMFFAVCSVTVSSLISYSPAAIINKATLFT